MSLEKIKINIFHVYVKKKNAHNRNCLGTNIIVFKYMICNVQDSVLLPINKNRVASAMTIETDIITSITASPIIGEL